MDGMDGLRTSAQRVGRIVSVAGSQAVCVLERDERGEVAALQIGGLVKTNIGKSQVYGIVSGVSIPVPSTGESTDPEMKVVELLLIGEATAPAPGRGAVFRRGVSVFPSLGDAVYATSREDLVQVYAPPAAANISIGTLHHDRAVHAHALLDELLGKHFAVLGTTGAGKSCAAAVILRQLVTQNPNSHIVLLDPHGEYARAFGPRAEMITAKISSLRSGCSTSRNCSRSCSDPASTQSAPKARSSPSSSWAPSTIMPAARSRATRSFSPPTRRCPIASPIS
jgi:hypothetical protein